MHPSSSLVTASMPASMQIKRMFVPTFKVGSGITQKKEPCPTFSLLLHVYQYIHFLTEIAKLKAPEFPHILPMQSARYGLQALTNFCFGR